MKLETARVVVTGAAAGIGKALAKQLAARGCQVVVADYDLDRATAAAREIGPLAHPVRCDVSEHASVEALAEQAYALLGGVDAVFANAGVSHSGSLIDATPEQLDWVMGVNVRGVWSTASVFARCMIAGGEPGHICITASEHSLGLQHTGGGLYTASKHAALGLGEILRAELPDSLGVSVLCPGLSNTELHLSGRVSPFGPGDPGSVAVGAAVLAQGMSADEVAQGAIAGVERGDFLIVTHAISFRAAERRFAEISAAFAAQAPWSEDGERYDVNRVVAEVIASLHSPGDKA